MKRIELANCHPLDQFEVEYDEFQGSTKVFPDELIDFKNVYASPEGVSVGEWHFIENGEKLEKVLIVKYIPYL